MKASELIEKLETLRAQFGDLPVELWTLNRRNKKSPFP